MASFGAGFSISAVVSQGTNSASGTLYTAPANSYALVTLSVESTTTGIIPRFLVGGRVVWRGSEHSSDGQIENGTFTGSGVTACRTGVVVGPSQAVTFDANSSAHSVFITGVQFTNS